MNLLPPLPAWAGVHPLVVHFPIALLIFAPVLVIAGLLWRSGGRGLLVAAFTLMAVGTLSAWVAVGSGRAAGERAEDAGGPAVERVLDQHEELAETTRNLFTALTLAFAVMLFAPALTRRTLDAAPAIALHAAFLAIYAGGLVYLVNTAHQGGRLVHELGVHAAMTSGQSRGGIRLRDGARGEPGEARDADDVSGRETRGAHTAGTARGTAPGTVASASVTAVPAPGAAELRETRRAVDGVEPDAEANMRH